mmetsp:Transcript_45002/g.97853  ORF Transcript_45002/g.97853 Transcript_45002/m.97853 type:complete len:226 (-) Transcript_45002:134-811(-)
MWFSRCSGGAGCKAYPSPLGSGEVPGRGRHRIHVCPRFPSSHEEYCSSAQGARRAHRLQHPRATAESCCMHAYAHWRLLGGARAFDGRRATRAGRRVCDGCSLWRSRRVGANRGGDRRLRAPIGSRAVAAQPLRDGLRALHHRRPQRRRQDRERQDPHGDTLGDAQRTGHRNGDTECRRRAVRQWEGINCAGRLQDGERRSPRWHTCEDLREVGSHVPDSQRVTE